MHKDIPRREKKQKKTKIKIKPTHSDTGFILRCTTLREHTSPDGPLLSAPHPPPARPGRVAGLGSRRLPAVTPSRSAYLRGRNSAPLLPSAMGTALRPAVPKHPHLHGAASRAAQSGAEALPQGLPGPAPFPHHRIATF